MLRGLDRIEGCGIFEDYRWDPSLPDFARINVIYGHNGSGKTSLTGAFDGLRHDDITLDGHRRVSLTVEDAAGRRSTGGQDDDAFDRVLVFGEDYVARNHRFSAGTSDMTAVLTLGQRTADAEARLEELRNLKTKAIEERAAAEESVRATEIKLNSTYERISITVVSDLTRAGGPYRSRGNYSIATVKTAFRKARAGWTVLTDDDLAKWKHLIAGGNREMLPTGRFRVSVDNDLPARTSAALAKTPLTIVLDTLKAHPNASTWVQGGQTYHADLDQCIYCGSLLTEERKHDIEQHFSAEVAALQTELQSLGDALDAVEAEVDDAMQRIPARALLFEDLRTRHDPAVQEFRGQASELKSWCKEVQKRLSGKQANVLASVESAVSNPPAVDGSTLEAVRDDHRQRVAAHDTLVQEAARAVELHHLKSEESNVEGLEKELGVARARVADAGADLATFGEEIASLENVEGDPTPSAQVLTHEVSRLLGRSELRFEAVDGRCTVTRDGRPAIGLSVGERTAITLVHFFESVARFDASNGKPIVVIDDPVSSLDSNIFMGVSTYIWTEAVAKDHVSQVVLLTHNFELFRQWDVQVAGLHKNGKTRAAYPAQFYEIRSRHVTNSAGKTRRCPVIVGWPPSAAARKKVRSTYHHAFIAVADAKLSLAADDSLDKRLDAQLLFPNVIRRMLETFIAFKRPEWVGDFGRAMRNSVELLEDSGYQGDADALRSRLTRFVHANSHSETPLTDTTVSPDEVATAMTAVFTFMNQIDTHHFRGLCEVVGISPEELLQEPTSMT